MASCQAACSRGRNELWNGRCEKAVRQFGPIRDWGKPLLEPNSIRPAERFFAAIKAGDTPKTSQFSKLALEWVDLWLANMHAAFAAK